MTTSHIVHFYLYKIPRIGKSVKVESRLLLAWAGGEGQAWGITANRYGISFGGNFVLWLFCSEIRLWRWLHNSVTILKTIEFFTLK